MTTLGIVITIVASIFLLTVLTLGIAAVMIFIGTLANYDAEDLELMYQDDIGEE